MYVVNKVMFRKENPFRHYGIAMKRKMNEKQTLFTWFGGLLVGEMTFIILSAKQ